MNDQPAPRVVKGPIASLWAALCRPSTRFSLGMLLAVGIVAGIGGAFGGAVVMQRVSANAYCLSCHEMQAFVQPDYAQSQHFANRAGVRAQCADCHDPMRYALKDLLANWRGTIATRALYDAKRRTLAERVWTRMEATGSAACKDCHGHDAMDVHAQRPEAVTMMEFAVKEGKRSCVTCHKGVAHAIPNAWHTPSAR